MIFYFYRRPGLSGELISRDVNADPNTLDEIRSVVFDRFGNKTTVILGFGKKKSSKSGKEKASDVPDWTKCCKQGKNESNDDFINRMFNEQYGEGNWSNKSQTEYSKVKKHLNRK